MGPHMGEVGGGGCSMRHTPSLTRKWPSRAFWLIDFSVVRQPCFIGARFGEVVSDSHGEPASNPGCPYPFGLRTGELLLLSSWQSAYPRSRAKSKRPQSMRGATFPRLSPCAALNLRGAPGSWAAADGWPFF